MTSSQRDPKFRDELKKLNEDLLNVIETNHKKSPYYDFTNPIQDYVKELASLKDKYPLKANSTPAFSFGLPTTQTATTTTTTTFANNRLFSIPQQTNPTSLIPTLTFSTTTATPTPFSTTTATTTPFSITTPSTTPFSITTPTTTPFSTSTATTTPFSTTTATTTPFSVPFSFTGSLFGASNNNNNNNTTSNNTINNSSTQQLNDTQKTSADDTAANDGDEAEGEEDTQPPAPNVDKFEETNVKYEVRTKLYERVVKTGQASEAKLIGFGTLFVKELDTPKKLHLIVRQDPDLRKVLLNQIITEQVPISLRPKALQILVPDSVGQTTAYIAKVKDDNLAKKLFDTLNSVRGA